MLCKLEVIAFNIECCKKIQAAGAHRIELCSAPGDGGTTPSYGTIQLARKAVSIELFPIIRPRAGDFFYNDAAFEAMKEDVLLCKRTGCDGVVLGILNSDGSVDKERCNMLVELAHPMRVTFHRAFDRVADPITALETIISCGFERILTSGLQPTAAAGIGMLEQLIKKAAGRIIIMPGSGIRSGNILDIAKCGATEFHTSARKITAGGMQYYNADMKENLEYVTVDETEVFKMTELLSTISGTK